MDSIETIDLPYIGGANPPMPRLIIAGKKKKKRQTKFKTGGADIGNVNYINKVSDTLLKDIGQKYMTIKQLGEKIRKERLRFKSITNRGATKIKKKLLNSGSTKKTANDEKKKHISLMKDSLRKLILHHTLLALQEFNNMLKF